MIPGEPEQLAQYCERELDLPSACVEAHYGYRSLSLCIIDTVYSIGARYTSTQNTVRRYSGYFGMEQFWDWRHGPTPIECQESIDLFLEKLHELGVERLVTDVFANAQRTSTKNGIPKARAVVLFAEALKNHGVNYLQDIQRVVGCSSFEAEVRAIPGQRSGVSLSYFFMLTGAPDRIKPDRMVLRFLRAALGRDADDDEAEPLIKAACQLLRRTHSRLTPRLLDHAIWQYQRGRDH